MSFTKCPFSFLLRKICLLLTFLKQQVVHDELCHCSCATCRRIGMKTPPISLPLLNYFPNMLMMTNFHTFILFQLDYHLFCCSVIPIFSVRYMSRFGYNLLQNRNLLSFQILSATKKVVFNLFFSFRGEIIGKPQQHTIFCIKNA